MENNNDVFMLGGHEFHSRFILGSGKYNSHLIRAAVEYADAEIVTLALRRANTRPEENILDFIPKNVTLLRTHPAQEMQRKQSVSPASPGKWLALISSRSRSCAIPNTCFLTTRRRSKRPKSSQTKALSLCLTCIQT